MTDHRLARAIEAIDEINAGDPIRLEIDGVLVPKELAHSRWVTEWVQRLEPSADALQLLAARAHHVARWVLPRASFDDGRRGYLRWRRAVSKHQAAEAERVLASVGYARSEIDEVTAIMTKDPAAGNAVQVHEDALCLVFLERQFDGLHTRLGPDKTVDVVAKTLRKMSPAGIAAAETLELSPELSAVLARARLAAGGS